MRLSLINFRHHQKLELELPSQGVILLSGVSGAGKSTVLSAFEYLLYGKLRKISTFETTKTIVTLTYDGIALKSFEDEKGNHPEFITIMRRRDPSTLQLTCGDRIYKDDEAQGIINRLFGSEDVFLASSYLKQGERSILLDGKNTDKMLLIEQFAFNDDNIAKYKEVLSEEMKKSTRNLDAGTSLVKIVEGQVESYRVLNERPLTLYSDEVSKRKRTEAVTQVSLDSELESLTLKHAELWSRSNDLVVKDKSRDVAITANSETEKQIATLQSGLKVVYDTQVIEGVESQLQELQEGVISSQYKEEYLSLVQHDEEVEKQFKTRFGETCPTLPLTSKLDRDSIFSEKEYLERLEKDNLTLTKSNLSIDAELASLPLSQFTVDELLSEKETSQRLSEYATLRDKDTQRNTTFKLKYGDISPILFSPSLVQHQTEEEIRAEYAEIHHIQQSNQTIQTKISERVAPRKVEAIEEELEVATHLQEYRTVQHLTHISLSSKYPHDQDQLSILRDEEKQLLSSLTSVFEAVATLDPEELKAKLSSERQKLSVCGCKVECPQCNTELIYIDGALKNATVPKTPKKSKLAPRMHSKLPSKLGARAIVPASPVMSVAHATPMSPMSPGIPIAYSSDPPERIHQAIGLLQQNLDVLTSLPILKSLVECKAVIQEIEELQTNLRRQQEQARDLETKLRLELFLNHRTTDRTVVSLQQELQESQTYLKLQSGLQEFNLERYEYLKESIKVLGETRKQQEVVQAFETQRVLDQEARTRRVELLAKIYPKLEETAYALFDTQPFTVQYRDVATINQELQQTKRREECQSKRQISHTVDTERLEELRSQLITVDQELEELVKATKAIEAFSRQDETEKEALQRRVTVLTKLYPNLSGSEYLIIDHNGITPLLRSSLQLKVEVVALKSQLAIMLKSREVIHRIDGLKATLQVVPAQVKEELAQVKLELSVLTERQEKLRELRNSLSIQLQLQTMETQLQTQKGTVKDETKKFAVLDKLRLKALETETQTLDSTIASINLEMTQQLERLFDTPITVRFETVKTLKNGQSKYCINLAVNYRGVLYDDISQLSGGEAGRISLAVTLALNKTVASPILMLDESLSTLDEGLVDTVVDALKEVSGGYAIPIFVVMHSCTTGSFDHVVSF